MGHTPTPYHFQGGGGAVRGGGLPDPNMYGLK